jgi:AcrR family transcriptional regulator
MPRLTAERRQVNRQALLGAARACVARDGFHQTSIPDIAQEAEVSTGAIYRYFASKAEIVREVAREGFLDLRAAADLDVGQPSTSSVAELVLALIARLTDDGESRSDIARERGRVAVQAWSEALRDPELATDASRGMGELVERLAAALARGKATGCVPSEPDPTDGARFVLSILPGLVVQHSVLGLDTDAVARAVTVLLVHPGGPARPA